IDVVEKSLNISLDEPLGPDPALLDLDQGGVATSVRPEAVGESRELRLVIRLQEGADYFLQQFVAPGRHPQWSETSFLLGDVDPADGSPAVAFRAELLDDRPDHLLGHAVHGLRRRAWGHGSIVAIDPAVSAEVEAWVEQLSVDVLQNQSSLATILDDAQDRLGVSHLAYLLDLGSRSDLPPFAVWPAFPAADYYGGSVALGVAPRGSISCCTDSS